MSEEKKRWIDANNNMAYIGAFLYQSILTSVVHQSDSGFFERLVQMRNEFRVESCPKTDSDRERNRRIRESQNYKDHRAILVARATNGCELCHTPFTPDNYEIMHHHNYFRVGRETNEDVAIVCSFCHVLVHRMGDMPHLDMMQGFAMTVVASTILGELPGHERMLENLQDLVGYTTGEEEDEPEPEGFIEWAPFEWHFNMSDINGNPLGVTPAIFAADQPVNAPVQYHGGGVYTATIPGEVMCGSEITLTALALGNHPLVMHTYPRIGTLKNAEFPAVNLPGSCTGEPERPEDAPGSADTAPPILDPVYNVPFPVEEDVFLPLKGHAFSPETSYAILYWHATGLSNQEIALKLSSDMADFDPKRVANKLASLRTGTIRKAERTEKLMSLREQVWPDQALASEEYVA